MKTNIILIGFMGVGKGSVARAYGKEYGIFTIDSDDLIESFDNRKIKTIFDQDGEPYFRSLENRCASWLESSVSNTIISTGGGFYNQENINQIGKVVLLDSSFDGIYKRILEHPNAEKKLAKRPLFQDKAKAKELYEVRVSEYKKIADFTINVENKTLEEVIKELNRWIISQI